jgi:hypothetical protein
MTLNTVTAHIEVIPPSNGFSQYVYVLEHLSVCFFLFVRLGRAGVVHLGAQ